jgi:excisionase family DNA binding protein
MTAASVRRHTISEKDRAALSALLKQAQPSDLAPQFGLVLGRGQKTLELPSSIAPAIMNLVVALARHGGVSVVQEEDELTPEQAAALLGMSRPMLMQRVRRGDIPHRMVGAHHRLKLADVAAFRTLHDERVAAMEQISAHTREMIGKYGA